MLDLLKKLAGPSNYVEDPDRKANKKLMLQAMRQVESRGGEDTNHDGDAIGDYGLRPIAIQDIYEKSPELQQRGNFKKLLSSVESDKLLQDDIAGQYYDLINKKAKDDPASIAYGWFQGPQGLRRALASNPEQISKHFHPKKVLREYKRFSDIEKATSSPLDFLKK